LFACEREAGRHGSVDVGELIWLDRAAGDSGTCEHAEIGGYLLLEIEADAAAALVAADECGVGGLACQLGQSDCVIEAPHPVAGEKAGDGELARLPSDLMAVLKLDDGLELLEARIQNRAVGNDREIEQAEAQCPSSLVPLG